MKYKMRIICAYCQKPMGEKDSQHPGTSHGVCPECLEEQNRLLALLVEEQEAVAIPFQGEPMPGPERTMRDYYGV